MSVRLTTVQGHFGELLQGRLGPAGTLALITLPCPALGLRASRQPGDFAVHQPLGRAVTQGQAARLLMGLGAPLTGRFVLSAGMPVGGGAGASTAARVALARLAGATDPDRIAAACHESEGATDPLMYATPERLLWASRRGRILARVAPLPGIEVLGGFFGPSRRTDPKDTDFPDISDLVMGWASAAGDLARIARLAQTSAERTLALRGPRGDPTAALAQRFGALGWTMAHTGSARALIFAPGMVPDAAAAGLRAAGFCRITRFRIGGGA